MKRSGVRHTKRRLCGSTNFFSFFFCPADTYVVTPWRLDKKFYRRASPLPGTKKWTAQPPASLADARPPRKFPQSSDSTRIAKCSFDTVPIDTNNDNAGVSLQGGKPIFRQDMSRWVLTWPFRLLPRGLRRVLGSAVSRPPVALSRDSGSRRGEWLRQR